MTSRSDMMPAMRAAVDHRQRADALLAEPANGVGHARVGGDRLDRAALVAKHCRDGHGLSLRRLGRCRLDSPTSRGQREAMPEGHVPTRAEPAPVDDAALLADLPAAGPAVDRHRGDRGHAGHARRRRGPRHLMIATALGVGLTVLLGTGLMALVFISNSSGHDEAAAPHIHEESDRNDRPRARADPAGGAGAEATSTPTATSSAAGCSARWTSPPASSPRAGRRGRSRPWRSRRWSSSRRSTCAT